MKYKLIKATIDTHGYVRRYYAGMTGVEYHNCPLSGSSCGIRGNDLLQYTEGERTLSDEEVAALILQGKICNE